MLNSRILGTITALLIIAIVSVLFVMLPDSGAAQLMHRAFHLGWPGGLVIVALLLPLTFVRTFHLRGGPKNA